MNDVLAAFALLTILPVRRELKFSGRAVAYFPLVGAGLGAVLVALQVLLQIIFPPLIIAGMLTAAWALLTGLLHLDGVSDAFDALFAATTRERRLEILRDVHIGAFGAAGLVLVLILKFATLYSTSAATNAPALFLAPLFARWAMLDATTYPLARSGGMAAMFTQGLGRREIFIGTLITFLSALWFGWLSIVGWIVAAFMATMLARVALARLGGLTGDIYGLVCEIVELSTLLVGVALK